MDNSLRQLIGVIKDDPAVANVVGFTGGQGPSNGGFIYIALKPLDARKITAPEVINRLRPRLNRLPVASVSYRPLRISASEADRATPSISTPSSPMM
jgi:multidrug efflux pump